MESTVSGKMHEPNIEASDTYAQFSSKIEDSQTPYEENERDKNDTGSVSIHSEMEKHLEADSEVDVKVNDIFNKAQKSMSKSDSTSESTQQEYNYTTGPMPTSIYEDAINLLVDGFITRFLPSLVKAQASINQIKSSQSVLIETVEQETSKFTECMAIIDIKETMVKAKLYHNKLLKLRREMADLHEKSTRLKKRALKLQQQKQQEELTRAHNMEKEFEKERMLTARVASSHD